MAVGREDFEAGIRGDALHRVIESLPNDRALNYDEVREKTGLDGESLNDALHELQKMGLIEAKWLGASEHYLKVMPSPAQIWYTVDEAAQYLRVSRRTIYQLVKEMQLAPYKVGRAGHRRFKQEDIDSVMRKEQDIPESTLRASDDPVLAELWNNDNDAEYDRL